MSEPTIQELNPQQERAASPEAAEPRYPQRPVGMTVEEARAEQVRLESLLAKYTAK